MIETCIKPDPNFDRLRNTLLRNELPDRVPFIELYADPPILEAVLGGPVPNTGTGDPEIIRRWVAYCISFYHRLGYDYVPIMIGPELPLSWQEVAGTAEVQNKPRWWQDESTGLIAGREDFERYPWPRPGDADFSQLEYAQDLLPEGMKVIVTFGGIFEYLRGILGYTNMCMKLVDDRELVGWVGERIADLQYRVLQTVVQYENVGALWYGDDWGFKTQTLISPDDLREFVIPEHTKVVQLAHSNGLPAILHCCGNLEEVMDDIIDTCGYDAKHSFEDAIMPVEQVKDKYGARIAILGGIDVDFLARATPRQVVRRTREVLEHCMVGGGYCLGTGNSVANYIPVENYIAMLETGWRFGHS